MSTVARRTRVVSARELSRRMARLLDEIESEESAFVIVRYGRPSAMLVPFEEVAGRPKLPRLADAGTFPAQDDEGGPDEGLDQIDLDDRQSRILLDMLHCDDLNWTPARIDGPPMAVLEAVACLELSGLAKRGAGSSMHLTRKGSRVARRLDSKA